MNHRRLGILAFSILGAAGLRLYRLGEASLWVDELITLKLVRQYSATELITVIPTVQPHLPLYYVLIDLWVGLVGTTAAMMRLPSVIAGVLAVPAMYLLGRAIYDSVTGLLAAVFVALSRLQVNHSQQVRMYTVLVLFVILSYYLFYTRDRWYVPASLGLVTTHPFGVLPVLSQLLIASSLFKHTDWNRPRLMRVMGVILVPALGGLLLMAVGRANPWLAAPHPKLVLWVLRRFFLSGEVIAWAAVLPLTSGVISVVTRRSAEDAVLPLALDITPEDRLLLAGVALPLAVLVGVSYLITPVFAARYALVAAPPLYLLVSRGLSRLEPRSLRAVLITVLLVSMTVSVVNYHSSPQREQWDDATAIIESQADTDALVLVYDRIATRNVEYYLDRDLEVVGVVASDSGTGLAATPPNTVRQQIADREEVWVVFTHVSAQQQQGLTAVVGTTHRQTACEAFVGVRICRFERRPHDSTSSEIVP